MLRAVAVAGGQAEVEFVHDSGDVKGRMRDEG
jgi:hypothetical protein